MSFEKCVLQVAENSGITGAYFYCGSMFFDSDRCTPSTPDAVEAFVAAYSEQFRGQPKFSNGAGSEIAVDFVLRP